jgi:hypothetical protein
MGGMVAAGLLALCALFLPARYQNIPAPVVVVYQHVEPNAYSESVAGQTAKASLKNTNVLVRTYPQGCLGMALFNQLPRARVLGNAAGI